jgi:ATP-dependent Zn protease
MASNTNSRSIANIRKKCHETFELISTSYHEAGHVVYGLLYLIRVDSVSVFEEKRSKRILGLTHYFHIDLEKITDAEILTDRLIAEIGFAYAGIVAEKRQFKIISGSDKMPMFLKEGAFSDINSSAVLFQKYNLVEAGKKRHAYKQKLTKAVDRTLIEHWNAITVIAHALVKRKKLNYLELQKLLTTKTNNKKFWKEQFKQVEIFNANIDPLDEKAIKSILFP